MIIFAFCEAVRSKGDNCEGQIAASGETLNSLYIEKWRLYLLFVRRYGAREIIVKGRLQAVGKVSGIRTRVEQGPARVTGPVSEGALAMLVLPSAPVFLVQIE